MDNHLPVPLEARSRDPCRKRRFRLLGAFALLATISLITTSFWSPAPPSSATVPRHLGEIIKKCRALQTPAGVDSEQFHKRTHSDRFVPGTKPVLIRNARIWTGNQNGTEVLHGSILIDKGLIKAVGKLPRIQADGPYEGLVVVDAKGAWVTPGSESLLDVKSLRFNITFNQLWTSTLTLVTRHLLRLKVRRTTIPFTVSHNHGYGAHVGWTSTHMN